MKKLLYTLLGIGLALGTTVLAVQTSVPTGNGAGFLLQSLSTGNYSPVSLKAGTNVTISTTTSAITISASGGGSSFAWPFSAFTNYVSTSTTLGFFNGLFSTASSTFSGPFYVPSLSQGFAYIGSSGRLNSVASSSINISGFNNDSGYTTNTGTVTSVTLATPSSSLTLGGTNPVTTSGTINADINTAHTNTYSVLQNFNYSSTTNYASLQTSSTTVGNVGTLNLTNITGVAGNCLHVDTNGKVSGVGADCGTAGGEANTGATLGTGLNLYDSKSGVVLRFNSLSAGTNITLSTSTNSNTIVINSTASGSGNVSTSTNETSGQVPYWTTTSGSPAKLGSVATSSIANGTGITVTNGSSAYVIGSQPTINCNTATASVFGCLTSANWNTFNNKIGTSSGGVAGNLAMYTTTNGSPDLLSPVATSSLGVSAPITFSGTIGAQVGGVGGTFGCTTASAGVTGCLSGTDWSTFNNKGSGTITAVNAGTGLSGGGSSGSVTLTNQFSTSSVPTIGNLTYWTGTSKWGDVATSTATCSSGITCNAFTVVGTVNPSFTNSGVTSILAGSGIAISGATGAVTITSNGPIATSTADVTGNVAYFSTTNGTPAKLANVATSSIASGVGITVTNGSTAYVLGAQPSVACNTASNTVFGCLTSANWNTFNNKIGTSSSGVAGNLAMYTTTNGTPDLLSPVATTSATCSGSVSCTSFSVIGSTPITISGSASGGAQAVSTSTNEHAGRLAYFTTTSGSPAKLGEVATTSETCSSPLSCTSFDVLTGGGAITLSTVGVASGGTNSTSFPANVIIGSSGDGLSLIATSSNLTVSSILATSTSATSTFMGPFLISPTNDRGGFPYAGMDLKIVDSQAGGPTQVAVQNMSTAGAGLSAFTLANKNTVWTANPYTSTYYSGLYMASPYFNTYPGLLPNDTVMVSSDANLRFASLSTNSASSSITFSVGPGFSSANYDVTIMASSTKGTAMVGIGTSTPKFPLQVESTTTPQFALSAGTGVPQITMRNQGGILAISSTTVSGLATSTPDAVTINTNAGNRGLYVGTSTPGATGLAVVGTSYLWGLTSSAGLQAGILCLSSTNEIINESVACVASSQRYKHDIETYTGGLSTVLALRPVTFHYNLTGNTEFDNDANRKEQQLGFIAEEAQKVDPRLIAVDNNGEVQTFRYENYTAVITKAIQDFYHEFQSLVARVSGLEQKVNDQDAKIKDLETRLDKLENK